jgi:hypothetical protein
LRGGLDVTVFGRAATVVLVLGLAAAAAATRAEFYGFVKTDVIYDFRRVDPAWDSVLRPSQIPISRPPYYKNGEMIFSLRASRVGVSLAVPGPGGEEITGRFEIDFFGTGSSASQRLPRLRQAYGQWRGLLVGQTWSLFSDVDVYPLQIEFWGPCGQIIGRRPQIRFTPLRGRRLALAVAVEQPGQALDSGRGPDVDPSLGSVAPVNRIPDLTVQLRLEGDRGHLQYAGLARVMDYETLEGLDGEPSGKEFGWGNCVTGALRLLGEDRLRAQFAYGHGMANYINDGAVDLAPSASFQVKALPVLGWLVAVEHWWTPRWSSAAVYSETRQENSEGQRPDAFETGRYAVVNLLFHPVPGVLAGAEFGWAELQVKDDRKAHDARVQLSFQYHF